MQFPSSLNFHITFFWVDDDHFDVISSELHLEKDQQTYFVRDDP